MQTSDAKAIDRGRLRFSASGIHRIADVDASPLVARVDIVSLRLELEETPNLPRRVVLACVVTGAIWTAIEFADMRVALPIALGGGVLVFLLLFRPDFRGRTVLRLQVWKSAVDTTGGATSGAPTPPRSPFRERGESAPTDDDPMGIDLPLGCYLSNAEITTLTKRLREELGYPMARSPTEKPEQNLGAATEAPSTIDVHDVVREIATRLARGQSLTFETLGDGLVPSGRVVLEGAFAKLFSDVPSYAAVHIKTDGRDLGSVLVIADISGREITTDVDLRASNFGGERQVAKLER